MNQIRTQRLAKDHGILPLLYSRVKSLPVSLIPTDTLISLRKIYLVDLMRNELMLYHQRICALLTAEGVQAVPVKGGTLALQTYGELALRHYEDIDILLSTVTSRAY